GALGRGFWNGGREGGGAPPASTETAPAEPPPRPFAAFRDPFLSGTAERMSPDELVRYSFEALLAWAQERGLPRQPGETPLEFVDRLSGEYPKLEEAILPLVNDYAGLAYARRSLTPACHEPLRHFWQLLAA